MISILLILEIFRPSYSLDEELNGLLTFKILFEWGFTVE